ncbi:MAG: DUF1926 domain-containing protein [Chloroflexi bacterium]|nr:DUF1926 domain-containing protein [Chloroflexota bacterium]
MGLNQIYLGLALHNHQPVGNFPHVFEQAYQKAYLPLVHALEAHPAVRLSLHYSGPVWDWLMETHPDFLGRVAALHSRGQVELMTGGYYEPVLASIPDADKRGQISRMTGFLQERFSAQATGLWLAERVWEPYLAKPLAEAGVEWTLVDDNHFKMVGLEEKDLLGYYLTEEQGCRLKVFPSLKRLRYSIPWRDVSEVMSFLREAADESGTRVAVMGDDGEKFGVWPETYQHCWEKGWMETFFKALEENSQWLHLIHLGEFARKFPPVGRAYLPCASYDEMLEWALPAARSFQFTTMKRLLEAQGRQDVLQYLKGGFWRHFQVKYPEANWMHKKMLWVHRKVHQAAAQASGDCGRSELWQGQCNCPYWHGVFGGLYLSDIRSATYHHLVLAEKQADRVLHGPHPWLHWEQADMDYDGQPELTVETQAQSLWLKPAQGGSLVEWDLRQPGFNLLSTLARRPEAYHLEFLERHAAGSQPDGGSVKSIHNGLRTRTGLPATFYYDSYPRVSLVEHILPPDATMEDLQWGRQPGYGNWANSPYEMKVEPRQRELALMLKREGDSWDGSPLRIEKQLVVGLSEAGPVGLEVVYRLTNTGSGRAGGLFGSEWNINLLGGGHNPEAYYRFPGERYDYLDCAGHEESASEVYLGNRYLNIELGLRSMPEGRLWRFPIETVSNSEAGLEKSYQASCLVLLYRFDLEPASSLDVRLTWTAGAASPRH